MMNFGKTIKRIRQAKGLTQEDIYERAEDALSSGALSRIENDRSAPSVVLAKKLCDALEVSIADVFIEAEGGTPVEILRPTSTQVPIISWVQAGNFNDSTPGMMANGWIPFDSNRPRLYALEVKGESMTSTSSPSFPEGSHIVVDPDRQAQNKDLVIARIVSTDEATFKQLLVDGPFIYLKPLNNTFPTMQVSEDHRIDGVIIGMHWKSPTA